MSVSTSTSTSTSTAGTSAQSGHDEALRRPGLDALPVLIAAGVVDTDTPVCTWVSPLEDQHTLHGASVCLWRTNALEPALDVTAGDLAADLMANTVYLCPCASSPARIGPHLSAADAFVLLHPEDIDALYHLSQGTDQALADRALPGASADGAAMVAAINVWLASRAEAGGCEPKTPRLRVYAEQRRRDLIARRDALCGTDSYHEAHLRRTVAGAQVWAEGRRGTLDETGPHRALLQLLREEFPTTDPWSLDALEELAPDEFASDGETVEVVEAHARLVTDRKVWVLSDTAPRTLASSPYAWASQFALLDSYWLGPRSALLVPAAVAFTLDDDTYDVLCIDEGYSLATVLTAHGLLDRSDDDLASLLHAVHAASSTT